METRLVFVFDEHIFIRLFQEQRKERGADLSFLLRNPLISVANVCRTWC